jgi:hypothetical protein
VPGMGPPRTADAPVGISAPMAKALADKQAIILRRAVDCIGKMGRASQLSTGRDACFIVRDANGQALRYTAAKGEAACQLRQ